VARATGITFDRTPAGKITAPEGKFLVCAYHVDFDERPTCTLVVNLLQEANHIGAHLHTACRWNVDFVTVYDDKGKVRSTTCPWA
jgi:hypothetical protein